VKGLANVQLENGYTRIANDILEHMARIKLSPTQYRILFLIWRCTYGFSKKEHEMSLSFIGEATGIDKRNIQRELKSLEEKKIIHQSIKNGSYRKLSFNKNYEQWVGETAIGIITIGETTNGETHNATIGETNNGGVGETHNATIGETNNQKRNNKEIYKERYKESSSSSEENQFSEIINFYTRNLQRGVSETPNNLELINQWFGEFGFDLLLAAMKVAAKAEAKGVNYTEGVLKKWKEAGVTTIDGARKFELEFKQKRNGYRKRPIRTEVLPDWFDEEQQHRIATPEKEPEADVAAKKQEIEELLSGFRNK
jgi:phage replication O-like protein O